MNPMLKVLLVLAALFWVCRRANELLELVEPPHWRQR